MGRLTLSTQFGNMATEISNTFIDKYMPLANGEFVKIYVYLLRCVADNQTTISVSALADFFNQTEADIIRALKYWDKAGAISLVFNKRDDGTDDNTFSGITFCDLNAGNTSKDKSVDYATVTQDVLTPVTVEADASPSSAVMAVDNSVRNSGGKQHFTTAGNTLQNISTTDIQTAYPPSKLKPLTKNEDFSMLIYAVSAYLGGELSPSETSSIAYFYDTLHFPADLIDYLVEYCVSRGKKSMRYIEKVALSWAESGIKTVGEAKAETANYNEATYSVLNAFGITGRAAGKVERDFINKWTDVYCFNSDIIVEACNRTLRTTHQPSFEYADSILSKWQAANVKTTEDIKRMDIEFEQNQQSRFVKRSTSYNNFVSNTGNNQGRTPKSSNRFNNFHQRNTDIDGLESALLSNN
ncbi:MAG: DnaD domain protein [Lachnospira sp.]|nr:DnaD domain protein [Lachnospira sp.]